MASFTGYLSGGLLDTNTPDYAGLARKNEKTRQSILDLGLGQINSVFGGGESPFYSVAKGGAFDPQQTYYKLGPSGFTPYWSGGKAMWNSQGGSPSLLDVGANIRGDRGTNPENLTESLASFGGSDVLKGLFGGGGPESDLDHVKKAYNRGLLYTGASKSFEGFQPNFYEQRVKDYTNYAMPQLAQQFRSTRNSLNYGLANRGLLDSSTRNVQTSNLNREMGQNEQQIADTARNQANELRKSVEGARQGAINYLYQTGDPGQATQQAIGAATEFRQPSTFAPIANMFSSLLSNYYTSKILNQSGAPSFVLPPNYSVGGAGLGDVSFLQH